MSKYSLKNIMLGFGIGVVFVSMINLNAAQRKLTVDEIKKEAEKYNLIVLDQKEIINKQNQEQNTTVAPQSSNTTPSTTPANTASGNAANTQTNTAQKPPPQEPTQPPDIIITIPDGMTSERIADILVDNGLVNSKVQFLNRLKAVGKESRLHSGKFTIQMGTSIDGIIDTLVNVK